MHKTVVNQIMLTMGLEQSQTLATVFDGISRHNPEGLWFRRYAQRHGFKAAARALGHPLPTLPLWLSEDLWVMLDLEPTYEDTCRVLHIA